MREEIFRSETESLLKAVINGKGGGTEINPSVAFNKNAKAGRMDALSDDEYMAVLEETEELAAWWHEEPRFTRIGLLQSLLEAARPGEGAVKTVVDLLSQAYRDRVGEFTPEISCPDYLHEPAPEKKPARDIGRSLYPESTARPACGPMADDPLLSSPTVIYEYLTERIHGQREACRAAASLLYHHVRGHRRSMLMVGPTGCGKTEIWRVCASLYPHIITVDTNRLTAEGWAGSFKVRDIFANLTAEEIEQSVVVFDEFDKLCEPKIGSGGTNHSHVEQDALLKLLEGSRIRYPAEGSKPEVAFDASRVSFVFLGSFESLTQAKAGNARKSGPAIGFNSSVERRDDFDEYSRAITLDDVARYSGMRREIAGRIGAVVQLRPMESRDFREILLDEKISPIKRLEREYGVRIIAGERLIDALAGEAAANRMGVRYLISRVQALLDEAMFRCPDRKEYVLRLPAKPGAAQEERSDTP